MYGLFFHVQVLWVNALIHNDKTFLWDVQKYNECNKAINKELFWDKFILRARSLRGHPAACACGAGCIITHKLISNPDVTSATRAVWPKSACSMEGIIAP